LSIRGFLKGGSLRKESPPPRKVRIRNGENKSFLGEREAPACFKGEAEERTYWKVALVPLNIKGGGKEGYRRRGDGR